MKPEDKAIVKQALEAMELNNQEWKELADSGDCGYWKAEDQDHYKQTSEAITALRQLLEQPEQEPVFCEYCGGNDDADFGLPTDHCTDCDRPDPAQPAHVQEPDAVVTGYHGGQCVVTPTDPARVFNTGTAFYTQPADHSEQDLDMVENGDLLTIVYMDGVHTGKKMAKREWVGLTDEDLYAVRVPMSPEEIARAIEQRLKEKNT